MSSSSSSSSSLLDSTASSILGASAWNNQKADRPVQGRPLLFGESSAVVEAEEGGGSAAAAADDADAHHRHLLQKRHYHPNPKGDEPNETNNNTDEEPTQSQQQKRQPVESQTKTELESAVLLDCLSTNFLWAHLPRTDLEKLCDTFERCHYRNHEVICQRGEAAQHVYILYRGEVEVVAAQRKARDDRTDGTEQQPQQPQPLQQDEEDGKYTVLGELAVLTGSPYQQTVHAACSASSNCTLFRLGRVPFHAALRPTPTTTSEERLALFKGAIPADEDGLLEHFSEPTLQKLCSDMVSHTFQTGDVLVERTTRLDSLVIIAKGKVVATNVTLGGRSYDDQSFGPGESRTSFGWQSMLSSSADGDGDDEPTFQGTMVAKSDGTALVLNRRAFQNALGGGGEHGSVLHHLAAQRLARNQLRQIPVFQDSCLEDSQVSGLLELMHRCEYSSPSRGGDDEKKMTIVKAGEKVEAAMHFVREGSVTLLLNKGETTKVVEAGGYFGEANMLRDQNKDGRAHYVIRSPMSAIANGPRTVVDVLYLEECRTVVNTRILGLGRSASVSAIDASIQLSDLDRHTLLGTGSFGQVWLASAPGQEDPDELPSEEKKTATDVLPRKRIVALKVQAKYQLIQSEKAERVVAERNILASLHSPYIVRLYNAFQDESRLYMITSLLQGGELGSIIPADGLSESAAKFYAAGILEGLTYMHQRHIIHRDIKPGNILLNNKGYPVLIDFGFAKYVPDKTYTFCGSPMFTAPEIIRYKGHDKGCDIWAWAVLIYRMVTGRYPFYAKGIDEMGLYKRICKGTFELDGTMSVEFRMLMVAVLYPDPAKRLGANGWREIFNSPWFANDNSVDLRRLRRQDIPAPWVPNLNDSLDASSFHPDSSKEEDLMGEYFPPIAEEAQTIFDSFGPQTSPATLPS